MSDREILELGLTRGALSKLRRVLATIESSSNHVPNGFTNHAVIMPHQCASSHVSLSPSHAPLNNHPVTSSTAHSHNTSQTCSQSQQLSTTTNQGKTGGAMNSETSQSASQKAKSSPSNIICKESAGSHISATNNLPTGSPALIQGTLLSSISSSSSVPNNSPAVAATITTNTATTTIPTQTLNCIPASTSSTTSAIITNIPAVTSQAIVNTSTASANIASTVNVTQCHSVTISSSQKSLTVSTQQPPPVSSASVETTTSPITTVSSHGSHSVSVVSQTRPSVLPSATPAPIFHYINTPPPPYAIKTTPPPPPTGLPQHPITSQPPPSQHRTSPPSLCVPPRTPSQEPSTPSTSSGIAINNGSQQVRTCVSFCMVEY